MRASRDGKEERAVGEGMLASDATRRDQQKGRAEPEDESEILSRGDKTLR